MIQIGAPTVTIESAVDHLMACHRRIEQRLDTLVKAADHLENNRDAALDAIRRSIQFLDSSGALHTEDEEVSLFPRLQPKLSASEIAFVDALLSQHDEAESVYAELKRIVSEPDLPVGQYRECAGTLQALYRDHIRAEDENLMPMAARLLSEQEKAEIACEMRSRR